MKQARREQAELNELRWRASRLDCCVRDYQSALEELHRVADEHKSVVAKSRILYLRAAQLHVPRRYDACIAIGKLFQNQDWCVRQWSRCIEHRGDWAAALDKMRWPLRTAVAGLDEGYENVLGAGLNDWINREPVIFAKRSERESLARELERFSTWTAAELEHYKPPSVLRACDSALEELARMKERGTTPSDGGVTPPSVETAQTLSNVVPLRPEWKPL